MRYYDMFGTVAAVSGTEEIDGTLYSQGSFDADIQGDLESDAFLDTAVQPYTLTPQVVDMELWVGGERVELVDMIGELEVVRDYDNLLQGWSFKVPLRTAAGLFGTPFSCIGPPIGKLPVDIYGVYVNGATEHRVPLITNGIVDTSPRESGQDGHIEEFHGVDGGGRFDGKKITVQFPPGHGLTRGQVGREIFKRLEDPKVSLADGEKMLKELQIVDAEPLGVYAEVMESENRKLLKDSEDFWINPMVGRIRDDEDIRFNFTERDFLRLAAVRLEPQGNVITLIVANGTEQVAEEHAPCTTRSETIWEVTVSDDYTPIRSLYKQNEDGTYDVLDQTATAGSYITRKVKTTRVYRCDTLIEEIVVTWEMARRERTRHRWYAGVDSPDDDFWKPFSCYTDDQDDVGGGPAYMDRDEHLQWVETRHTKNFYLHKEFLPHGSIGSPWRLIVAPGGTTEALIEAYAVAQLSSDFDPDQWGHVAPYYGQAEGTVTFVSRLGHIEGEIKDRLNARDTWEDIDPPYGRELWGNGSGFESLHEADIAGSILNAGFVSPEGVYLPTVNYDRIVPWSMSVTGFEGTAQGFLESETFAQFEWRARRGNLHYFGDNDSRSQPVALFSLVDTIVTSYAATGETHTKTVASTDNITGKKTTVSTSGLAGHLPAIAKLDFVEANAEVYEDGEQTATDEETGEIVPGVDKKARRGDTKQIVVTMSFDFFLTCHIPREIVTEFPWAENAAELAKMCEALASESAAMPFFGTLPANFIIREGMAINVTHRALLGEDGKDIRVKGVRWVRTPDNPIVTEIEGRLYEW